MDPEVRLTLVAQLRALAARTPGQFEPPGCHFCGADVPRVQGSLCQRCVDRLAQLDRPAIGPGVPSTPTVATFVSADPKFVRRSDARGRRRPQLPFDADDGAA